MAAYNFPANPEDGQLYPNPAKPGAVQYVYSAVKGTWLTVYKGIERISTVEPLRTGGSQQEPVLFITKATELAAGSMSAEDKRKLDSLDPTHDGTVKAITAGIGLGAPGTGNTITETGTIDLLPPTPLTIGGVKTGFGVTVLSDGSLSLVPPSSLNLGGVKQGAGLAIDADGVISIASGGTYKKLDNIAGAFNGTNTQFQMTVGGIAYAAPISSLLIFVGGVIQIPGQGFNTAAALITFTSAPPSGASFFGISLT